MNTVQGGGCIVAGIFDESPPVFLERDFAWRIWNFKSGDRTEEEEEDWRNDVQETGALSRLFNTQETGAYLPNGTIANGSNLAHTSRCG
jgi:hypothetical protein